MIQQQYKVDFLNYVTNGSVKSDCADITFINQGTSTVVVNNAIWLLSGQSVSITANAGEIDTTTYNFYFDGVGTNKLIVVRKIYI